MRCLLLAALTLTAALAAPETPLTLSLRDAPLTEAVAQVAAAGDLDLVMGPDLPAVKLTVDFAATPAIEAIERLIRLAPGAAMEVVDGVVLVKRAVPPVRERAPQPVANRLPAPPPVRTASPAAGQPSVGGQTYWQIRLNYAYAPRVAELLGGRGLRLSDLDPWLSRVGPTRSTAGGQTLQPPEGIDELVGVDWTNSLIGR